jgi:hypothetical protein
MSLARAAMNLRVVARDRYSGHNGEFRIKGRSVILLES